MIKPRTPATGPPQVVDLALHVSRLLALSLEVARAQGSREPEDVAGEVLVRLLSHERAGRLPSFESFAELKAYTQTMARNLARDHARRRPRPDAPVPGETRAPAVGPPMTEPIESALPTRQRLSIVLRNRLGFSYQVLAGILEHPSPGAAQRFHSRSLDMLRGSA